MQWMSKWKMTREEITQTMIKWKRKKTGRTLIKRQTKIRKGKHEKASRCFKQIHQDRLPASACCFCKGIVPRSWNGNPNFLETFATWGCSFFVVRFCTAKGCWFRMKFNGKKNCHQEFEFSWTNKLCLGAWLRFRHWTAFNPMFFPPIMKVEAGPFGFTGLPSRQQIRQTNTTILWTNMYNPLSQFFRGRDLPHLKKATIKHQHYDMPNHCGAIRP